MVKDFNPFVVYDPQIPATRSGFLWCILYTIMWILLAFVFVRIVLPNTIYVEFTIVLVLLLIPVSFLSVLRRLKDLKLTGWLSLILLVPYVDIAFLIYLIFAPGKLGKDGAGNGST
jgi:uncharacterized membrane protein YhaH (DUF805 family)